MEGIVALIVIGFIIGFPIYFLYLAKPARVINKLHSTKLKKIANVDEGEIIRIKGRVRCFGKTLVSPLYGRKCSYYHTVVEQENKRRHGSRGMAPQWFLLIEEEISADIVISDGKNYAVIDSGLIDSYLVMDKESNVGYLKNTTTRVKKYLEKHGHKDSDNAFFGTAMSIRYKEGILEEGELIAVCGKATWKTKKDFKFELPAEKILFIYSDDGKPVQLSDDPFAVSRKIEN